LFTEDTAVTTDPVTKSIFRRLLFLLIVLGPALVFLAFGLGLLLMYVGLAER
jgi:F0F1-type ATP synthase membrane subunit c/vacuolar-type H+-ATPase subunit K